MAEEGEVQFTLSAANAGLMQSIRQASEGLQGFASIVSQVQRTLAQAAQSTAEAMQQSASAMQQAGQGAQAYARSQQDAADATRKTDDAVRRGGSGYGLGDALKSVGEGFRGAAQHVFGFTDHIINAINPLQMLHSHILRLVEVMGLWRIFEYGTRMIHEFTSAVAELPVTMERTEMSWKYTFGMNDPRLQPGGSMYGSILNPDGTVNDQKQLSAATNIARDLSQWSAKFSYNIPYTRQDMLSSISMMGMTGLSEQGVETYLPLMADLAATAGNNMYGQPVTLTHAAFAIMDANMGLSRSLKTQLRISPEDLKQYGYVEGDPSTLWKALSAYSEAKHRTKWIQLTDKGRAAGTQLVGNMSDETLASLTAQGDVQAVHLNDLINNPNVGAEGVSSLIASGKLMDVGAARDIARGSWFGLSSSWTDRWQNMMMDIGGYAAYDTTGNKAFDETGLRKNSPFAMARKGLQALTDWWDTNQSKLNDVATFFSNMLAQGLQDAGEAIQSFVKGVANSGIGQIIGADFQSFSDWLRNPTTIANIKDIAANLGNDLGDALKMVQTDVGNLKSGWDGFWNNFTPEQRQELHDLVIGDVAHGKGSGLLGAIGDTLDFLSRAFARTAKEMGLFASGMMDLKSGNWNGALDKFGLEMAMSLDDTTFGLTHLEPTPPKDNEESRRVRGEGGINHPIEGAHGSHFGARPSQYAPPPGSSFPAGVGWAIGHPGDFLGGAGRGLGATLGVLGGDMGASLGWWGNTGIPELSKASDAMRGALGNMFGGLLGAMGSGMGTFFQQFGSGWNSHVTQTVAPLLTGITTLFSGLHDPLQHVHDILQPLIDKFGNLLTVLQPILNLLPGAHSTTGKGGEERRGGGSASSSTIPSIAIQVAGAVIGGDLGIR